MAFLRLKEPKSNVKIAFKKAINYKDNNICAYIDRFGTSGLETSIPKLFNEFYKNCKSSTAKQLPIDLKDYSINKKLDYDLVLLINELNNNDKRYRKEKDKY